jgi:adenylylsulfate kinase
MGWAIWISGSASSGRSGLARAAAAELRGRNVPVQVLELDAICQIVTPVPTGGETEREVVHRVLAFMAASLVDAGVPVIVEAIAHRGTWRELARGLIERFAEVQLGAASPEREPGPAPELVIDTAADTVTAAASIGALANRLGAETPGVARHDGGWAVWITGRPGSGKTTIARQVMAALAGRGLTARTVDASTVRRLVPSMATAAAEELVHRAVVCLARLLVEWGVAVVVDATAHRRRWRELARDLIPRFAEIQLVCPPEVCAERERAARWHLGPSALDAGGPPADVHLEWVLDYEAALRPELTIYTEVQDRAIAVQEVLFVAERLHRRGAGERSPSQTAPS